MKILTIALGLILLSTPVFGDNWMPVSKIQSKALSAYQLESECLKTGEQCLNVGDEPEIVKEGFAVVQDNYLKADMQECESEEDCDTKFLALVCSENDFEKIKNYNLLQVYCTKFAGKVLVKDQSGWTGFKSGKAQIAAFESGKAFVKKLRECLAGVIDLLVLRNESKNLTVQQVESMVTTYQPIMDLLYAASGVTAKLKISEVVADGVLVTESDKTALTQEINKCLGLP